MKIVFENQCKKTDNFVDQTINLFNEPTIGDYLKKTGLISYMTPVADIVSSPKKCGYHVEVNPIYKNHQQWVYVLTIGGRVVKIGNSTMTLSGRWNSYTAGTRKNRNKGTCSTTNYFISEIIRVSLLKGFEVKLYGYPIPNRIQAIDVFGDTEIQLADFVKVYEGKLIKKFNDIYGKLPIVGKNGMGK
jgi:autotransporter-associated beta strand protein